MTATALLPWTTDGTAFAGPTVILDQHYDTQQGKAVPDSPYRTALVYPLKNNYVLFDGRLGHGVLDSTSAQPRMTLLINWWADKPQVDSAIAPCEVPSESVCHPRLVCFRSHAGNVC